MAAHAASSQAKIEVEQLQTDLGSTMLQEGMPTYLTLLKGVPLRSMAMLVCKVMVNSEFAVRCYPRRSPMGMTTNHEKMIRAGDARFTMPLFLIHFS
jgi:hypothetical protein